MAIFPWKIKEIEMNKEAMLEIADLIEKSDPKNFHMGSWFGRTVKFDELKNYDESLYEELEDHFTDDDLVSIATSYKSINHLIDPVFENTLSCNTTACIAGWTVFNDYIKTGDKNYFNTNLSVESKAREILGLSTLEAYSLFFCEDGSIWDRVAPLYEFDYDRETPETWKIPNIMAADVLRKIANGQFSLSEFIY